MTEEATIKKAVRKRFLQVKQMAAVFEAANQSMVAAMEASCDNGRCCHGFVFKSTDLLHQCDRPHSSCQVKVCDQCPRVSCIHHSPPRIYTNYDDLYKTSMESTSKKKKRIHKGENVECTRNSKSMGNLHELCNREEQHHGLAHDDSGNHSDDLLHLHSGRPAQVRKKGIPWTPSEHRCFLIGLEKLGKGDWKGISKNYVPTKTPAQVASHAQKYFLRITAAEKKNRRASLFDIPFKQSSSPPHASTAASFNASEGSQQDGLPANIAANEKKPPLSPATGTNASDACHISYINSPAHASTAASFHALEGSQQVMTAAVDPLKKASENHGLDGLPANIATNEKKPPLSPATRTNAPDACHISYIAGVPGQSFPAPHVMPQTELYPMLNYTYPNYYYDSSSHANFPAKGLFLQPHSITHGTSQSTTNNYNS